MAYHLRCALLMVLTGKKHAMGSVPHISFRKSTVPLHLGLAYSAWSLDTPVMLCWDSAACSSARGQSYFLDLDGHRIGRSILPRFRTTRAKPILKGRFKNLEALICAGAFYRPPDTFGTFPCPFPGPRVFEFGRNPRGGNIGLMCCVTCCLAA